MKPKLTAMQIISAHVLQANLQSVQEGRSQQLEHTMRLVYFAASTKVFSKN